MKSLSKISILTLITLFCATVGLAERQVPKKIVKNFNKLDADKSESISAEEAKGRKALRKAFDQVDSDGDGLVTLSEYEMFVYMRNFNKRDSDKNGTLTRDEASNSKALRKNFDKIDVDGDGILKFEELTSFNMKENKKG